MGKSTTLPPYVLPHHPALKSKKWVCRLIAIKQHFGRVHGLAFCTLSGSEVCIKTYELDILDRLHSIQTHHPALIPADINVHEEYGLVLVVPLALFEARSRGVDDRDVDLLN